MLGSMCLSLRTLSFSRLKSAHIRTCPSVFGRTIMAAHQSVSSYTFLMMCWCSMRSRAACTRDISGSGMRRGTDRENGTAFS